MTKPNCSVMSFVLVAAAAISCARKTERNPDANLVSILDSLSQIDPTPIKKMPDTLHVSPLRPLHITTRENSDSVVLYPYSLLFEGDGFNTYIVSFNDFSPTLVTLDHAESIVDSMTLIGTIAKENAGSRHARNVVIRSPDDIIITDSVLSFDLNEKQERIVRSARVRVNVKKIQIGQDGKISVE